MTLIISELKKFIQNIPDHKPVSIGFYDSGGRYCMIKAENVIENVTNVIIDASIVCKEQFSHR